MKKISKVQPIRFLDIKLFALLMSGCMVASGAASCINKNNNDDEINIIHDETLVDNEVVSLTETSKEASRNIPQYTYTEIDPVSDEYYRSIIIDGRTLNFANTPTPTPAPNYELIDAYTDEQILGEDGVYPEGYLEYKDRKDHSLKFDSIDEMISFYSKVFELKEDAVSKVIYDMLGTNEYELDKEVVINDTYYNSVEEAIARTVFDIYYYPDYYGYSYDDIISSNGYELDYYYAEEFIYKFSEVLDVNPYIALAIAYGESGRKLDSNVFVNNHNAGGIVSNGGFAWYKNEACGMFEYVKLLHDKYFVTADSDYSRLKIMSNGYCEDPSYWINLVGSIYYELCNYGYGSTFYDYRYDGRDLIYSDEEDESFVRSKYYTGN